MDNFKEFKIVDVLTWQPQKEIDPLMIKKLSIVSENKYPFYGQATINNGIISYLSLTDDVLNNKEGKPTILIHSNNQNIVYLETPFYLKDGHGATSVLQADFLNEKTALYIMACIKKVISKKFSYNEKATKIALKNTKISLPINQNNEIDYVYMEKCIRNVEDTKIKSILDSLKSCELDTCELTKKEQEAIDLYRKGKVIYKDFTIKELFDIHPTKSYKYTNKILYKTKGKIPVLANSSINNGIGGYVDLPATEKGGIITFSDTTSGSKTIFYQPKEFIGYSHVQGLYPYNNALWTENTLLYFMTVFKKSADKQFDYSIKFTRTIAGNIAIKLPVSINGDIDFGFMENIINSQKKLSIKNFLKIL
ncbi:hypothetical protein FDC58_03785 [Clostridium botulinum]|nr:hypothetical protein [Clostridium botulinum]NFP28418.1 hypothetical protein [Clostridium botulinum]